MIQHEAKPPTGDQTASVSQITVTPTPSLDPAYTPCVFSFYNGSYEYPTINMADDPGL